MRIIAIALALALSACSQPAPESPTAATATAVTDADAQTQALLGALSPVVAAEIGAPISLETTTVNVQGEWAYVVAQPRAADGSQIDWMTTNLASRYQNGVMDQGGSTHALLKNENGAWRVVTHVIAPTDVAWEAWPAQFGAPPELFGLPPAP